MSAAGRHPEDLSRHRRHRLHRRAAGARTARGRAPGAGDDPVPGAAARPPLGRPGRDRAGRRRRRRARWPPPAPGVDVVYYLVHALGGGPEFEETDRRTARGHGPRPRRRPGVRPARLPRRASCPRARSSPRTCAPATEVAEILLGSGVPTAVLRAAVVLGSGSASFEMLRYLTERLPVMVTPRWVHSRIQPIAVRDVLRYLVGCAGLPASVHRAFDVGGPDVMNYAEMMQRYAAVAGLPRRRILPVPLFTPVAVQPLGRPDHAGARPASPARWWSRCATPSSAASTTSPSSCPTRPEGCSASTRRCGWPSSGCRDSAVATRWASASVPGAPSDPLPTDPDWAGGSLYVDERTRATTAVARAGVAGRRGHRRRARLVLVPAGLGGARLAGPAGRRGRAAPRPAGPATGSTSATPWTSGGSRTREAGRLLRLRAEMRLPGPGLAGVPRGTRTPRTAAPCSAARHLRPARPGRPPLLVGHRRLPRHRLRRDGPRHHPAAER